MTWNDKYDKCEKSGKVKMAKNDICLFFDHDDGQEWCNYWKKMMSCSQVKLSIEVCDTLISAREFKAKVSKSKLLVILTTSNMLQFIQEDDSHFGSLSKRTCVANIHCHTSQEDMGELYNEPFVSRWKIFVASDDGVANRSIVGDLLELIEKQAKKRSTKMRKFKIMPCHVREPAESIALIFKNEVTGRVEVSIGADETRHIAKMMNPFTFAFRIPDTCENEGKSRLKVYTNGTYFGEHPITVILPTLNPYQAPAFLSQILRVPTDNRDALDKALAKVYQTSLPEDDALECILGDFYDDALPQRSKHEIPTLLHFAAKNGLSELCSLLLDTPGSLAAFQQENRDGYDPADLADKHGHTELCDYLRAFVDVETTVQACEDIYLEMSGRSLYANQHELNVQTDPPPKQLRDDDTFNVDLPQPLSRSPRKSRRHSEPTPNSSRPPLPAPRKSPGKRHQTPEEFMGMTDPNPQTSGRSATLGSTSSAAESELIGILSAVKDGEFTLSEAERLYESWKKHNHSHSVSMKERKEGLDTLRNEYVTMFDLVKEKNKEKGVFKKIKNKLVKKKSQQDLKISTPTLLRGSTTSQHVYNRNSGSSDGSRASGSSQASASSYDMGFAGSDSDDLLDEDEEESSGEEAFHTRKSPVASKEAEAGEVQMRLSTSSNHSREARKTMRLEFLETARSFDDEAPPLPPRTYNQC
ncbi:phosphoinositide 3-kinase adapter protein 1-like [Mizuhopecten yessoensis]|uniref:Phosphoinositide 3-kinase adapter protein 1 n=1 Tax=Mizuhopecten yessoensis TaxID=6573 RepID=A0A210QW43_MIZYE|nr:phosphoinositide 3-kinase adapter protein 1-like [Mizuhopecten yessoensis]OWF52951.1 Phosphoinositide 3-kinase adapter protein 1 [Mizuhopecten yessoensis]